MKRKKPHPHSIKCPNCKGEVGKNGVKQAKAMEAKLWAPHKDGWFIGLRSSKFWACDECLTTGKAIKADPDKQLYLDQGPYLAYFDKGRICERCGDHYIFGKYEQLHWYEELQFWVQSVPKHCAPCRKEIRKGKDLNTELSDLLKDKAKLGQEELSRVIEIYAEMGNTEKVKYYQAQLRKLL